MSAAADGVDPFASYTMQDLLTMNEGQWRQYIVHQNYMACTKLCAIEKMLKRRPEVVRANLALVVSIIAVSCTVIMTAMALWRA